MAARVYRRTRTERSQFWKLGFGKVHWTASDVTIAPVIKYDRRSTLLGYSTSTGKPTSVSSITGTADAVVKVPGAFVKR